MLETHVNSKHTAKGDGLGGGERCWEISTASKGGLDCNWYSSLGVYHTHNWQVCAFENRAVALKQGRYKFKSLKAL